MAYNTATITANEPLPNEAGARIFVQFTGNAGEPVVNKDLIVDGGTTAQSLRLWAANQTAALNNIRPFRQLGALQPGQTINTSFPAPPALTAKEIFAANVRRLRQMTNAISLGVKANDAADYTTLKTSVTSDLAANPTWIDVL